MYKILISILLFSLSCSLFQKKKKPVDKKKQQYTLSLPNLRIEKYPKTFNLKGKGPVILPCGSSCTDSNLETYEKANQAKGFAKNGAWEEFFEKRKTNGERYSVLGRRGKYVNDKREGEWLQYYESGEILYRVNYRDGKKQGKEKKYKSDGTLIQETTYLDDKKEGPFWRKSRKGYLAEKGTYKQNEKQGLWVEYYKNSQVKNQIHYDLGKRDGRMTTYYENGQKQSDGSFSKGVLVGHWRYFYENGRLEREGDYVTPPGPKPKRTGIWKKYYQNGDLFSIGELRKSKPTGIWTFYNKGNIVRARGKMRNEFMMTEGEIYDENGLLWGKGVLMSSLIKLDREKDMIKAKFTPNYPFTYYKNGNRDLVVKAENDSGNMIAEIYSGGRKIGEGPISDARLRKKNGCWTINGKKVYYMMNKVKTGMIAKMNDCQ